MSGRKSKGNARISGTAKVQKTERFCKYCDCMVEAKHVLIVSKKKKWVWRCGKCGAGTDL